MGGQDTSNPGWNLLGIRRPKDGEMCTVTKPGDRVWHQAIYDRESNSWLWACPDNDEIISISSADEDLWIKDQHMNDNSNGNGSTSNPEAGDDSKVSRSILSIDKVLSLHAWLVKAAELDEASKCPLDGSSYKAVAARASADLGFVVTERNVSSVAKSGGVKWRLPRRVSGRSPSGKKSHKALAGQVETLSQRILALEDALRSVTGRVASLEASKPPAYIRPLRGDGIIGDGRGPSASFGGSG